MTGASTLRPDTADQHLMGLVVAHEIGHLVLHSEHYKALETEAEWIEFHQGLSTHVIGNAEWQANWFAGSILVPPEQLRRVTPSIVRGMVKKAQEHLDSGKVDAASEAFWSIVAREVGAVFGVAGTTARYSMEREGLWRL